MVPIRLAGFNGANLALHPKLLPDGIGVSATNMKPGKGDMRPWKVPLNVATAPFGTKTLYRFNKDVASDTDYWFTWSDVVNVVRGFIADDSTERTYYTGDGAPKVTDNVLGLAGSPYPTAYRTLGIPAPTTLPILSQTTAGTGTDEDRYYVYTFVSDFGEESQPSPVSAVITVKPGAVIAISNLDTPPAGSYGIATIRIYRTVVGTSGTADFFFLMEIATATTATDAGLSTGVDVLPSVDWAIPPSDLHGLTGLWNGMMAGITGKAVRFCEPFKPYAWPPAYETLCTDTPVALGTYGKNLLILTTGAPRLAQGSAPEAMDDEPVPLIAACVSAQSVVSFKHGVCWASADGLAYVGNTGAALLTQGLMGKEDWQDLSPDTMIAGQYRGRYMAFYYDGSAWRGFMIDPLSPTGVYFFDQGYSAVYYDELQETFYVLQNTDIKKWDAGASNMTATFRSKEFRQPKATNPGVAEVIADSYPVTFKLYADGALKFTKSVAGPDEFYLPGGYLANSLQVEVSSDDAITGVVVAETVDDIKQT
jgi:hypothetical protein